MIRLAQKQDVARMLEIYSPYVRNTAISFEYVPPSLDEFMARFENITQRYPWIVWVEDGIVLGYAYADRAFERMAYQWDADLSIYLDQTIRRRGIGSKLYECLEKAMSRAGYHTLYGVVTSANQPSCRFHEARGYELQGVFKRAGYKMGKWYDVSWYALYLNKSEEHPEPPRPFEASMLDGLTD